MTTYGVTAAGFTLKPVTVIQSEITSAIQNTIDPTIDVAPDQPLGQLAGIFAAKLGEVWELAQVAYNAFNRGDAEGDLLANIGMLTGTPPQGPTPSMVWCDADFSAPGTYAAGTLVAYVVSNPAIRFANATSIVVPATKPDGSAVSPTNQWRLSDQDTPYFWAALENGPTYGEALIAANAAAGVSSGQLSGRVPVAGWESVSDFIGGVAIGTLEETDPDYRVRQYQDLSAAGNDTLDATRAAILVVLQNLTPPVAGANVQMYENTTLVPDANGLPPKSYMAVVFDGVTAPSPSDNLKIGQAIWDNKPAGIQSFGATAVNNVLDAKGVQRTVYFTRPTQIPITMAMTIYVSPSANGAQIAALVQSAIYEASRGAPFTLFGAPFNPTIGTPTTLVPGQTVVANAFKAIAQGQAGVLDVQSFVITSPAPDTNGNVPLTVSQVGVIAAPASITVAVSTGAL